MCYIFTSILKYFEFLVYIFFSFSLIVIYLYLSILLKCTLENVGKQVEVDEAGWRKVCSPKKNHFYIFPETNGPLQAFTADTVCIEVTVTVWAPSHFCVSSQIILVSEGHVVVHCHIQRGKKPFHREEHWDAFRNWVCTFKHTHTHTAASFSCFPPNRNFMVNKRSQSYEGERLEVTAACEEWSIIWKSGFFLQF